MTTNEQELRAAAEWKQEYAQKQGIPAENATVIITTGHLLALLDRLQALEGALKPFVQNVHATSLGKALGHITRENLHHARAVYEAQP